MNDSITYISGNKGKINEIKRLNNNFIDFTYLELDLIEIQGTAQDIAKAKCKTAFEIVKGPVLIEDSSLYFTNLGGLPGPYIKDFMKKLDLNKLAKLGENSEAEAKCIYAYFDNSLTEPKLFIGNQYGKIVYPRKNSSESFGWDPIFEIHINNHQLLTYAELTKTEKDKYSDRSIAFNKFKEFIIDGKFQID